MSIRTPRLFALLVLGLLAACGPSRSEDPDPTTTKPKAAKCNNGVLEAGETCDPKIATGKGACPTECASTDACRPVLLTGSAEACTAACTPIPVTKCQGGDGCCAPGCNAGNDADCGSGTCGNGQLDGNETCDGDCPASCNDNDSCTTDTRSGSPASCNVVCQNTPVSQCRSGDGCCPSGCSRPADTDCGGTCPNGQLDAEETCDGNCPTSCNDFDACTTDTLLGSASTCSARCVNTPVTACRNGDGCCPDGCTRTNDTDCAPTCGNNQLDNGETCDGDCPTSCDDFDDCTTDTKSGSPSSCDVQCTNTAVTRCVNGDGCCPSGCTTSNDNDCSSSCPNGCASGQRCVNGACTNTPLPVGTTCTETAGCEDGSCLSSELDGWPGGYCSKSCSQASDCPSGTLCQNSRCLLKCSSNATCRSGYECQGAGTSAGVCVPVGRGAGAVGAPCTTTSDCGGTFRVQCLTQAGSNMKGGYCSLSCDASNPCPSGSHCVGTGSCVKDCSSSGNCRGAGYACFDQDNSGNTECYRSATGSGAPGAACAGIWECGGGQWGSCLTVGLLSSWPGGYCSIDCDANEGTCPSGSVCDITSLADIFISNHMCLRACTAGSSSCRAGYTCRQLDGLFGPTGAFACRP